MNLCWLVLSAATVARPVAARACRVRNSSAPCVSYWMNRVILHAGLSEVSVADIEGARRVFPVATVQNSYSLVDRDSEDVLAYCAANKIAFIPWFPLAAGKLTQSGGIVDRITKAHAATAGQISLAWLLQRSPASYRSLVRSGLPIWKRTWWRRGCHWAPMKSANSML